MSKLTFSAPLKWPSWVPVTPLAYRSTDRNFAPPMQLEESIGFLNDELEAIGCKGELSLDIDNPLSERMKKKVGSRIGAVLELDYMDEKFVIACDKWQMMEHNIYALHLSLRQWRNMERWGIAPLVVLLAGFATQQTVTSKPSASTTKSNSIDKPGWMEHLGLGHTATLDDAQAIYHRRAKKLVDDTDALTKLNITMEEVRAHFAKNS